MVNLTLPHEVAMIIKALEDHGFEAFVVGGCVRDTLMKRKPQDWDISTSALPEEILASFHGRHIIKTGLKHGTVALVEGEHSYEITTYRRDGIYSNNRHPDSVEFTRDLETDLSRRDFTINALAYNPSRGLVDYFSGEQDIASRTLRTVGNADERFQEDSLRILRALRFASVLGFEIEEHTSEAIFRNKALLQNIAAERIANELNKLLLGNNVEEVLLNFTEVFIEIIPEISDLVGFEQNTPYHYLDVWEHTVKSISEASLDNVVRLSMLMHDMGKPEKYTERDSIGHFYGHPQVSADIAQRILKRLKYDNKAINAVHQLVLYHGAGIKPDSKNVKRWLNRLGEARFRQLLEVKLADAKAKTEKYRPEKLEMLAKVTKVLDDILAQEQCFSLKSLAIQGNDLIALGVPEGRQIGDLLSELLDMVIDEKIENEKDCLLEIVKDQIHTAKGFHS